MAGDAEEGIERSRRLFDASVAESEESSVALYSLGSPELLAAATDEVIGVLQGWGVLGPHRDALEIGCGIGRLMVPLCARVRSVVGTDVSPGMIAAATRRLAGHPNASVQLTSGKDLSAFDSGSLDLVYSVDTFPYLVLAGHALVERHVREIQRVLRPGGDFVLFNYAYGRSREDANAEVLALAHAAGLQVVRADESPFRIWNGIGWLLRRGS
jgi:SAM-dependent methyltransferase